MSLVEHFKLQKAHVPLVCIDFSSRRNDRAQEFLSGDIAPENFHGLLREVSYFIALDMLAQSNRTEDTSQLRRFMADRAEDLAQKIGSSADEKSEREMLLICCDALKQGLLPDESTQKRVQRVLGGPDDGGFDSGAAVLRPKSPDLPSLPRVLHFAC